MNYIDINSTALTMRDYQALPTGKYLLMVDGIFGARAFVPVDKLTMDRMGNLHGYRMNGKKQEQVICFHGSRNWYLVDRSYLEVLPLKDYMKRAAEKGSEFEKYHDELKKEYKLKDETQELIQAAPGEGGGILYL